MSPLPSGTRLSVLGAAVVAVAVALLATASAAPEFRISLSVSPFTQLVLGSGGRFTDGRMTATTDETLQELFVTHGANEVYARISTRQHPVVAIGDHSVERGLQRAQMAAKLHLPFNPELGLFASYGDIRCQPSPDFTDYGIALPGPWESLTLEQMLVALRAYGAAAARQIVATGATVRIWDLGNEVDFGVAGVALKPMRSGCDTLAGATNDYRSPDRVDPAIGTMSPETLLQEDPMRRIAWLKAHIWPHEARMFAAVAAGIRTVDPKARFSTHVSGISSTRPDLATAFFVAMKDGGFLVDEAGVSYYPTSSKIPADRFLAFRNMAVSVKRAIRRPVFVAEFGYPSATMSGLFSWNEAVRGYALTPEGQALFIRDLVTWGRRTGVLSGIRPWGPDFVVLGWAPMALFERNGSVLTARPGLDAFAQR